MQLVPPVYLFSTVLTTAVMLLKMRFDIFMAEFALSSGSGLR